MKQAGLSALLRRYGYPVITIVVFSILLGISVFYLLRESKKVVSQNIVHDIEQLGSIFKKIDDDCKIMSFDHQKNPIDFLTVEKFVGSEIGSMNVLNPKKWQGPYTQDNPNVQGKVYQVVRTAKGHFITPGDGVQLGNGKIIGKDIVLDEKADIAALMLNEQALRFEGKPMATPIQTSSVANSRVLNALVPNGL